MKLLSRKSKTDPALARYPAAMAELLELGDTDEEIDYASLAEQLRAYTPDLIRLVLDEDFADREDAAALAPFHALEVLAILGPAEAAEPLLACLAWETDWANHELARAYVGIGPVAIPLLLGYLEDGAQESLPRTVASNALKAIAEAHPAEREQIVDALTRFLDRPTAADSAEEELTTAFVISDLTDLRATSAYDAIARAFAEDRVDTQILDLEFVEAEWGMRPRPGFNDMLSLRTEPGVRLLLKCKACGRERAQVFPKVYYDLGTVRDEKKRAKYDPLIIPQRVICPKCGAVDQYEVSSMEHTAIMLRLLAARTPEGNDLLRPDQQVKVMTFTTRWGNMHPVEADERYRQELAGEPGNADLHVGYANLQRFRGYPDEAMARYHLALTLDSNNAEAWVNLAQMAGERRDMNEAIRCWEKVRETSRGGKFSDLDADFAATAEVNLVLLHRGVFPGDDLDDLDDEDLELALTRSSARGAQSQAGRPAPAPQAKIGRNEPCPCGSGKKYKHCHGRK